jgi:hypothetical protein
MKSGDLITHASWWTGTICILAIALLPVAYPDYWTHPLFASAIAQGAAKSAIGLLPLAAAWLVFRNYPGSLKARLVIGLVCLLAACYCEHIHHQFVDEGYYFGPQLSNAKWQRDLHLQILAFDPGVIPHSYRFLSASLVAFFEWLSGDFWFGQSAFRILFDTLLLAMTFRYARLFVGTVASLLTVLGLVLLYPVTIAHYAGQSLDPISHFSFVLCFYLLEKRRDAGMLPTLFLGVLAKESVAVMAACRIFYGKRQRRDFLWTFAFGMAALIPLIAVRIWVVRHGFSYQNISNVSPEHVLKNLGEYDQWLLQYLFALGVLIPGAVLGWRFMPRSYRWTCLLVTAALVVSSAFFSWLNEARNLVPAMILLLIVNMKYLETRLWLPGQRLSRA